MSAEKASRPWQGGSSELVTAKLPGSRRAFYPQTRLSLNQTTVLIPESLARHSGILSEGLRIASDLAAVTPRVSGSLVAHGPQNVKPLSGNLPQGGKSADKVACAKLAQVGTQFRAAEATAKVWPLMGFAAMRARRGGGWRLWVLARSLDENGSGVVELAQLVELAARLRVAPRTFARWLSSARRAGFVSVLRWKSGERLALASAERVALALGCETVGVRPATVPIQRLARSGWRAALWAAFESTTRERPISRGVKCELTGVAERSQRRLARAGSVREVANYVVTRRDAADWLAGIREFVKPHAFGWRDTASRSAQALVAWRVGNSSFAPGWAQSSQKGRSSKINQALRGGSFEVGRAQSPKRIFFDCSKRAERAARKSGREVFARRSELIRASTWAPV